MRIKAKHDYRKNCFMFLMALSIVLVGCTSNENTDIGTSSNTNNSTLKQEASHKDSAQLLDLKALQDENETLKQRIAILEDSDIVSYYNSDFVNEMYTDWSTQYPHLTIFTEPQQFDSIELSSEYGEVVISDPALVQYANYLFIVKPSEESYPGGHYPYDIEPFNIKLTNSSGSYGLHAAAQNYVTFEEDSYFVFQVSPEVARLGKALLPRPTYLPEESLESRMINSGGIIVQYEENPDAYYYDFTQSRQLTITKNFLESEKKLVPANQVKNSTFVVGIIYLLYGEQIIMNVYEDYIFITDYDGETLCYKIDPDLAMSIPSILNAG